VTESRGNKRVGDHLLTGLERLLPSLIDMRRIDIQALRKHFPAARLASDSASAPPRPRATWLQLLESTEDFVDFVNFVLPERTPAAPPAGMAAGWQAVWTANVARLAEFFPTARRASEPATRRNIGSLLAYVYWRIGFESGALQRMLSDADVSWGTYPDEMGTHCNAHANNLVLLPEVDARADPKSGRPTQWLSLLDLDMAFTRASYMVPGDDPVPAPAESKRGAKGDVFDAALRLEVAGLRGTLAGDTDLSTGVTATAAALDDDATDIKWALR
jgi:hypothetical protein